MRWRIETILTGVTAVVMTMPAPAQEQAKKENYQALTFRVQSQLVQIYMTVTEGARRVTDLKLADFKLAEDGIAREVDRLDAGTVPLQVALLLDTSDSMREALPSTQEAAAYFVESLNPGDRVTLIPFNSDIRKVPQLTDDRGPILQAIRSTQATGGTKLYDALLFAMKHLHGKEGRKAIVTFSDGEDTGRGSTLNIALNAAARYGFPIYTIGAGNGLRQESLKRVLRQLADINSGKTYFVEDPRHLRDAFEEVGNELRSAYVLNYYTNVPFDGRWHDLAVTTANPKQRIHCRKGFYAKPGTSGGLLSDMGDSENSKASGLAEIGEPATPLDDGIAKAAAAEIMDAPVPLRSLDATMLPLTRSAPPDQSAQSQKKPLFKVESKLVEVPVVLEWSGEKEPPQLSEKDFRIYEDDALKEIAFFSREVTQQNISDLRDLALKKVNSSPAVEPSTLLSSDAGQMLLGRYFLVVDDLLSDTSSFVGAKKAVEKILREYDNPLRRISLHFTSEPQASMTPDESLEKMTERLLRAVPRSDRELTNNDGVMTIYEAYLIERGDRTATQLAELRYASSIQVHFRNDLGEVEGQDGATPEVITNQVLNTARHLVVSNFAQVSRALDGLRAVVGAAASDTATYPKVIIFMSSGYSVGRGSGRADMAAPLDRIVASSKENGIRFFTVDLSGLSVDEALGIGASGAFLVRNPHLSSILAEHSRSWRFDRQSPLNQLAVETGGRFLHSTNDIATAGAAAIRTTGQLYYLGYLSRQPVDGRFHRIRVTTSLSNARVHTRKGYYAGIQNAPETLAETSPDGAEWSTIVARANQARKSGDMKLLAESLEQLVRRFPDQIDFWYNLGVAHLNLKNPVRAVESLQKAFALSPNDKNIGLTLSQSFVAAGYRQAASDTLEMLARRHPQDLNLLVQLGRVYESDARPGPAYRTYRKILDLMLAPPLEVYLLLTRTSMRLGRHFEARVFMDDYLARGGGVADLAPWREHLQR